MSNNDQYPRLLLLISRQTIDRGQKNQGLVETIVKSSNMGDPEIVDGADGANVQRREELFSISGLHATYPQVFLLESATATPQFLGGSEGVKELNERGKFTKNAILGIEEEEDNKENEAPEEAPPAPEPPVSAPDAAAKSEDVRDKTNGRKSEKDVDAAPKSRGMPTDVVGDITDPARKKSKGLFSCFGSKKKKNKPNSEETSTTGTSTSRSAPVSANSGGNSTAEGVFGNRPLKKTSPASAANTPKKTEPSNGSAGVFGNKPLKKTSPTTGTNTPKNTESSNRNTGIFGNKPLRKTPPPTASSAPKKTDAPKSKGMFGNKTDKKTASPAPKKKKDTNKSNVATTKPSFKATAKTTKVDPSNSHPKGTWHTQTTMQRLCGCCFK